MIRCHCVKTVEIKDKFALTFTEAALYFNVGINNLRRLAKTDAANCTCVVGNKTLIIRPAFEKFMLEHHYLD